MVIIAATLNAKPGMETQLKNALLAMIPKVRAEKDTLTYTLHRAEKNPCRFFFYECYTDQAAAEAHFSTPHFKQLFETIKDMLADAPQVEFYEKLAGLDDKK